ncbi:MAG TPA: ABC transporter permease [Blastocatellia bacterium]|nr:ABC transporter permease [Blastocatellia bacterium]
MQLRSTRLIYFKEMLDLLRDRRTIISMIIIPIAVMPLLFSGVDYFFSRSRKQAQEQRFRLALKQEINLDGITGALEQAGFQAQTSDDPRRAVEKKDAETGVEVSGQAPNIAVKIYADLSQFESEVAIRRIEKALDQLKDQRIKLELQRAGLQERILTPFRVERVNTAPPQKMSGLAIGNLLGYMIVIFMLTGGMYPGIDMTAGEKERRTMEMLLSSPASREEIVLGKVLATITATAITGILTIISLGISFYFGIGRRGTGNAGLPGQTNDILLDATTILLVMTAVLPMAVLSAALIIAIATLAKSFKEAQSYLTPLIFAAIFPAMVSFLPGIKLSAGVALIPIVNFSLLTKELMLNEWSWTGFALTIISNIIYAAVAFIAAVTVFKKESVLFRT